MNKDNPSHLQAASVALGVCNGDAARATSLVNQAAQHADTGMFPPQGGTVPNEVREHLQDLLGVSDRRRARETKKEEAERLREASLMEAKARIHAIQRAVDALDPSAMNAEWRNLLGQKRLKAVGAASTPGNASWLAGGC